MGSFISKEMPKEGEFIAIWRTKTELRSDSFKYIDDNELVMYYKYTWHVVHLTMIDKLMNSDAEYYVYNPKLALLQRLEIQKEKWAKLREENKKWREQDV